jgi:hypothetical protein
MGGTSDLQKGKSKPLGGKSIQAQGGRALAHDIGYQTPA